METMTPRQRVLTALDHQVPDRVPFDLPLTIAAYNRLREHLGFVKVETPFGPASDIA
ncbi:hypothetical protein MGLY_24860 [Neomoorella glycerini]|uniref:Uncharacterized protein n=1 Tax=Neomoorella glycerini TaxID=55779 RepID=A0A6I5ZTU0_9FIRM|nr:hypothetical protein MGLY_24860 [Moorella glycerini]